MRNFNFKEQLTEELLTNPLYIKHKDIVKINRKTVRYDKCKIVFKVNSEFRGKYLIYVIREDKYHDMKLEEIYVEHGKELMNILRWIDEHENYLATKDRRW